ncbi:1148_t:CDS:2, partial [Acaulospora morrowiae]
MSCGFPCVMGTPNRGEIRARYNIQGDGCTDCLTHTFCACCGLIQEAREVEIFTV